MTNQVIPTQAVEAAAKAEFESEFRGTPAKWEFMLEDTRNRYQDRVRAALEAAAPHIRADALLDAADDVAIRGDIISKNNGGMDAWDYLRARAETEKGKL